MDPNLPLPAPPAPPPLQPVTPAVNPYEFITQGTPPSKRGLFSGGSKKKRILLVAAGLIVLAIIASIIIGLIGGGAKGPKEDYLSLLQQQTEIIRISDIGSSKAKQSAAKNLAITARYNLLSQQRAIVPLAKKAGAPTDAKNLSAGKNSQTDTQLTDASQTNQFDGVFISTMQASLKKYQETLKKIYDEVTKKTTKDILDKDYTDVSQLISNGTPAQ